MSHEDIIRAWKDEEYWNSLSEEQRAQLPQNPAGMVELSDEAMQNVGGGLLSIIGRRCRNRQNTEASGICIPTAGAAAPCNNVSVQLVVKICPF
jgi:mersacidin/lichenicidin family type 2 lantibiotic